MPTTSDPGSSISPGEEDLTTAVASLKKAHPELGIAKLHALLLSENPSWTVSEKRLRRVLKNAASSSGPMQRESSTGEPAGPEAGSSSGPDAVLARVYPSSTLVEGLDVSRWTTAIEVKYFDKIKGKGLVAKEPISEGQVVWKEDPFVIAPEW